MIGWSERVARSPAVPLILGALPAVAAGFFVLSICDVGRAVWAVQAGAVVLMLATAGAMARLRRGPSRPLLAIAASVGLLLCALPLLGDGPGPRRWIAIGPVVLYIAPVVIPALLLLAAHAGRWPGAWPRAAIGALAALALVLATQPDLAQVLALAAGAGLVLARSPEPSRARLAWCLPFFAAGVLAAAQPDPLAPVPHVEQVIRVSWGHSVVAGVGVSLAAVGLVTAVAWRRLPSDGPLAAAAYYAVLFACSLANLTPAPLIGYGAGPLLGFGLLAGTAARLASDEAGGGGGVSPAHVTGGVSPACSCRLPRSLRRRSSRSPARLPVRPASPPDSRSLRRSAARWRSGIRLRPTR